MGINKINSNLIILIANILCLQFFLPLVISMFAQSVHATDSLEEIVTPSYLGLLENKEEKAVRFSFTSLEMEGIVGERIFLSFYSDQEVQEVTIRLPEEARLDKEALPSGIKVEKTAKENNWLVHSDKSQETFSLPLIFKEAGIYESYIGETQITIKIRTAENISTETSETIKHVENSNDSEIGSVESKINEPISNENETNEKEKYLGKGSFTELYNPFFSYEQNDQFINNWSMNIGPGILGAIREVSISDTLDSSSEFRYALDNGEDTDRVFFRKNSNDEGLRLKLQEDTTLIVGQQIQTEIGKEYLVRGFFSGNARTALLTYEGEKYAGSDGIGSTSNPDGSKESSFIAESSTYTVTARLFTLLGEMHEESSIESVQVGEKIDLKIEYLDESGNKLQENANYYGMKGEEYEIEPIDIPEYILKNKSENHKGILSDNNTVTFTYVTKSSFPKDPMNPEIDVNPENNPKIPEEQGLLSIDFVSQFNFGKQVISVQDQVYYAVPQRLLNDDGTVIENEVRPNYVQISDRRLDNERGSWQLAVTQNTPFTGLEGQELTGAQLQLMNQQLVTAQGGEAPYLQEPYLVTLIPGNKQTLLRAEGETGTGTWIYRFGNQESANESIALDVPKGTNPEATSYSTTISWELSAVPGN